MVRYINDPIFPDLCPTRSVVHDGETDNKDLERIFVMWSKINNQDRKVTLQKFQSILLFASEHYDTALCTKVVPRLVHVASLQDYIDDMCTGLDSVISGADGVVTILYNHGRNTLRKFLDLKGIPTFTYTYRFKDMSDDDPPTLPFMITRDQEIFGYRVGFVNGGIASTWDAVWVFKILANGEWKAEAPGGQYNASLDTYLVDAIAHGKGLGDEFSQSAGFSAFSALTHWTFWEGSDNYTINVTYTTAGN